MKRLTAIAVALAACSCATITRGTTQEFTIETTPTGAAVATSNGYQCAATPCTFRMPRKDGFRVDVTLEGYLPAQANVTSGTSGGGTTGLLGNVLVGGLIGMGVDATSGAMNDLSPNPLQIVLQPIPAPAIAEAAPAVEVAPADAPLVEVIETPPADSAPPEIPADAPAIAETTPN